MHSTLRQLNLIIVFFLVIQSAGFSQSPLPYNLNKPDKIVVLPEILNEVSGLTDIDDSRIACVQDELGIVFIFDFIEEKVISKHSFDSIGDFEGLTYAGKSMFVLRSDGQLTEWEQFDPDKGAAIRKQQHLPLLTTNNEGLCYDSKYNRLLVAAKSKPINHDQKSERFIYAYDLKLKKLESEPLYSLNTEKLAEVAKKFNIVQNDTTPKGLPRPFNFRPSSLAVHSASDRIYVISAADRLLVILNRKGEVVHIVQLDPQLFAKAEGITFLSDGTMIITNEAAGKAPTLLVFKTRK